MSVSQPNTPNDSVSSPPGLFESLAVEGTTPTSDSTVSPQKSAAATVRLAGQSICDHATETQRPLPFVPPSWLWLREHDQLFVGVCIAAFLLVGGYHWAQLSGWRAQPLEIDRLVARRYDYKIDINTAGLIEWTQIEGIGEVTAQKILNERAANGPFRNIADLQRVKGIGSATIAKIRPYVRSGPSPQSSKPPVDSAIDSDDQ